ncbi:MAG TPA: hypothetical protein VK528_12750 [Flavobacterium sp.]|nr:hypothetical protein [Flavobacterium sp.]
MKNLLIAFCFFAFAGTTFAASTDTQATNKQKNNNSTLVAAAEMSPLQIGDNDPDKDKKH